MEKEKNIVMYSDGGSRGNPGEAAIGVYIETLNKKIKKCIGIKTNNEAEYEALILGLKSLKQEIGVVLAKKISVTCFLDSELVVRQLQHKYRLKERRIQELFLEVWNLMLDFGSVEFFHILREKNKIADALVNEALDQKNKQNSIF